MTTHPAPEPADAGRAAQLADAHIAATVESMNNRIKIQSVFSERRQTLRYAATCTDCPDWQAAEWDKFKITAQATAHAAAHVTADLEHIADLVQAQLTEEWHAEQCSHMHTRAECHDQNMRTTGAPWSWHPATVLAAAAPWIAAQQAIDAATVRQEVADTIAWAVAESHRDSDQAETLHLALARVADAHGLGEPELGSSGTGLSSGTPGRS